MAGTPGTSSKVSVATRLARFAAAGAALVGLGIFARRRAAGPASRRPDDDGGLAGVREPRRPIPPTLVDAGAAVPDN